MPGSLLALAVFELAAPVQEAGAVQDLIDRLGADRVEDREEAERRLKSVGRPAVPGLARAAEDPDPEVAGRARRILRAVEAKVRLTPELLRAMPGIEDRLAEGLEPAWTKAFLEANAGADQGKPVFRDEDMDSLAPMAVRGAMGRDEKWAVCRIAARRGCRSAIPELIRLLDDPEGCVNAIHALRRLEAREAAGPLIRLLSHEDLLTCRNAADALGELRVAEALPELVRLARHADGYVRLDAAKAMKEIGREDAVPHLEPLLEDPEPGVRAMALSALAALGARESVPRIERRLADDRPDVRREAVSALHRLGAKETASSLVRLLGDDDPGVSLMAGETLVRWQARGTAPGVAAFLRNPSERVRETALGTLAGLGAAGEIPSVSRALKDPEASTRRAALRTLGWLGASARLPEIQEALRDADPSVREAAVAAAGDMRAREAAGRIAELLEDPDRSVRGRAARTLDLLGAAGSVPGIVALLQDDAGEVRRAAAEALCGLGRKEGVPALMEQASLSSSAGFGSLNALRRREAWRRLRAVSLRAGDALESASKGSGLAIDGSALGPSERRPESVWFPPWEGPSDGADLLTRMAVEAILEEDRIRLVPREQAALFWKDWWEKEREKE